MNDPEYLAHVADRAEELAGQLHAALTQVIVERVMIRLKRGVDYRLTASDKWMLEVLQEAGYLREDLMKELSARTGVILKEMSDAFEDAAVEAIRWDDAVYKAAGLNPTPLRQSPHLMRLVQRDYQKTAGEWRNFTGTLADASQEKFITECDKAYHLTVSHAMSYTQAIRQAVEAVAEDGVRVTYPSGHVDTIETATARAVRTGVGQACMEITLARMEELNWDVILLSSHLGARTGDGGENFTNHFYLQNLAFFSRTGEDKRFPPFSVCGFGDVQGIGGANCRHSIGPGDSDGEFNPYKKYSSEENRKREKLDQRQRALERRIRATRREVMGLQAGGDLTDEKYRRKAALLQRQEAEYDAFCKENDLKKLYDRLAVARYGPEQARAAERAARPPENDAGGSGGSFTRRKNIAIIQGERVPNSITAATPQQKLQGYLLNSNHPRGKDKARVFNSVLGYHYENWDKLSDKLFDGLQTSAVASVENTKYGIKYKVPMRIVGERGKSMVVNTVWQLDNGSTITRLITATFDKRTIRKEAKDAGIV